MTRAIHPRLNLQNDATCGTQAVYDYANAEGAVEVTVEDPNPQAAATNLHAAFINATCLHM